MPEGEVSSQEEMTQSTTLVCELRQKQDSIVLSQIRGGWLLSILIRVHTPSAAGQRAESMKTI